MSTSILILVVGFAVIWLLIVMPQRRRQKAHEELIQRLAPGDYVVTSGGLYGTVTDVGEDDLGLEVAPDVEVRVAKRAIGGVVPPEQIEEVEIDEEADEPAGSGAPVEEKRG
ncbi:MAG TPA: preprotein translocase subunit YajC [Gaiellaceae bacterium]|jgi:preprotein translocase subunit YajC|nr:preprotein translocase subunit YajC [Gaiellaceae bacterium]